MAYDISAMFDIFANSELTVERVENAGSYSEPVKYTPVFTVKADVQPVTSKGTQAAHGIAENAELAVFCSAKREIQIGMRVVTGGKRYVVVGAERRLLGQKLYLKENTAEVGI